MIFKTNNIVVAFAGPMASGKSTLALLVSNSLGWQIASFGGYVRKVAEIYGFDQSRKSLQKAGDFLISRGWNVFCNEVLAETNWKPGCNLIVDGVRHLEALDTLRNIVKPAPIYLIYVTVNEQERRNRLKARSNDEYIDLEELEMHPTEEQVKTTLFNRADLVVDSLCSGDRVVIDIVTWIRSFQIKAD